MATPDYKLCDICGEKVHTQPIFAATDRKMDAAGSNETVGEHFDLCPKHMRAAVIHLLKSATNPSFEDYEAGKRLCEFVQRAIDRRKETPRCQ